MSREDRAAYPGPPEPILRSVELFLVTAVPELDDDVKEWKCTGIPIRSQWGLVSPSGPWAGGGHRGEGGVKRRWRQEVDERESTLWFPDWIRGENDEASASSPAVRVGDRLYAAGIDNYWHVLRHEPADVHFELKVNLAQWAVVAVEAYIRSWDPEAHDGEGGMVTDCDADTILVFDANHVGHNADAGGTGRCEMFIREDGTPVGVIHDLCCRGDEQGEGCP